MFPFGLCGAIVLATGATAGQERGRSFPAEQVRSAMCEVLAEGHLVSSAFFVKDTGVCLTCAHALLEKKRVELLLPNGRRVPAERGAVNEAADAAVLFARLGEKERVPFLKFEEGPVEVGQELYLAGTPVYRHQLFLRGTVASRRTAFEYSRDLKTYVDVFYVSALAPRGTSGGAWLSPSGRVVGLQSGGMAKGDIFWGVAFAVPPKRLRALVAEPRRNRAVGDLGAAVEELWEQPPETVKRFSEEAQSGLLLKRILIGGACDRSGLGEGLLILAVDGRPCRFRRDVLGVVRGKNQGDVVRLDVLRKRSGAFVRSTVTVRLRSSAEAYRLSVR